MSEQQPLSTESTAFRAALDVIRAVEPRVADAIGQEVHDQREMLKLIASENYASPATLLAMGNWFSDKYAEGTIGRRFYAGCRNVDTVESLAAEHAKELFGARHAYVQPHSGIDANLVAFWSVLAQRVEVPALEKAGVRQVNDLSDADWAELRQAFGNQRMLGMSLDAAWPPHPWLPPQHLRQDVRPALLRHRPRHGPRRLRRPARLGP